MPPTAARYRGRFAPSPTGPLHLGSLLAAVASYLDARAHSGEWILRIEDIDGPRTAPDATDSIRRTLTRHGLEWSWEAPLQSKRTERYREALAVLSRLGLTFGCDCSRSQLAATAVYPGTCRKRNLVDEPTGADGYAIRVRAPGRRFAFEDRVQGTFAQVLDRDVGDFVVLRRDGIFAYQLAVVVDDADQGITDIVRGADLLDNTPRQLFLMDALGYPAPRYAHIAVLCGRDGQKLSKQTFAGAIDQLPPADNLLLALDLLGQAPPTDLRGAAPPQILDWAQAHWRVAGLARGPTLTNYQGLC